MFQSVCDWIINLDSDVHPSSNNRSYIFINTYKQLGDAKALIFSLEFSKLPPQEIYFPRRREFLSSGRY